METGDNRVEGNSSLSSSSGAHSALRAWRETGETWEWTWDRGSHSECWYFSNLVRTWPVSQMAGINQRQPVCSHGYLSPGLLVCFFQEPTHLWFFKKGGIPQFLNVGDCLKKKNLFWKYCGTSLATSSAAWVRPCHDQFLTSVFKVDTLLPFLEV